MNGRITSSLWLGILLATVLLWQCSSKKELTGSHPDRVELEHFGFTPEYELLFGKISVRGNHIKISGKRLKKSDIGKYVLVQSAFRNPPEIKFLDKENEQIDWRYFPGVITAKYARIIAVRRGAAKVAWEGVEGCEPLNPGRADGYMFTEANSAWNTAVRKAQESGKPVYLYPNKTYVLRSGNQHFQANPIPVDLNKGLHMFSDDKRARVKYGWEDLFGMILPQGYHKGTRKGIKPQTNPVFRLNNGGATFKLSNIDFIPVFSCIKSVKDLSYTSGNIIQYESTEDSGHVYLSNMNQQAEWDELKDQIDTLRYPMWTKEIFHWRGGGVYDFASDSILAYKYLTIENCISNRNRDQGGTMFNPVGAGCFLSVKNSHIGTSLAPTRFPVRFKFIDDGRGYRTVEIHPSSNFSAYQMVNQYLLGLNRGYVEVQWESNGIKRRCMVTGTLFNKDKRFAIRTSQKFDVVQFKEHNYKNDYRAVDANLEAESSQRNSWLEGEVVYDRFHHGANASGQIKGHCLYIHQHIGFDFDHVTWSGYMLRSNKQDRLNPKNRTNHPPYKSVVRNCFIGLSSGKRKNGYCYPTMASQIGAYAYLAHAGKQLIYDRTMVIHYENVSEDLFFKNGGILESGFIRGRLRIDADTFLVGRWHIMTSDQSSDMTINTLIQVGTKVNEISFNAPRNLFINGVIFRSPISTFRPMTFHGGTIVLRNGQGGIRLKGSLDSLAKFELENWNLDQVNENRLPSHYSGLIIPHEWLKQRELMKQKLRVLECKGQIRTSRGVILNPDLTVAP